MRCPFWNMNKCGEEHNLSENCRFLVNGKCLIFEAIQKYLNSK
jgi:hypothetical protein